MAQKRTLRKKKKTRRPGCLLGIALLILVAALILFLILRPTADPAETDGQAASAAWDGSWYGDDLGRIGKDKALIQGMQVFEKKTGVRPYLLLLSGVEPEALDDFTDTLFATLFSDGDHLLVIYDEWGDGEYYLSGRVNDESALAMTDVVTVLSCLEEAYADPANKSYAQAFGTGFRAASKALTPAAGSGGVTALLIAAGVMLALCVVLFLLMRRQAINSRLED